MSITRISEVNKSGEYGGEKRCKHLDEKNLKDEVE